MNYRSELIEVLLLDPPMQEKTEVTFLDIAGISYNENVISHCYAMFLRTGLNERISETFLNAIVLLIKDKTGRELEFPEHECELEVKTLLGNRIDIVIKSKPSDTAIIIENKIYHHLNNDLNDYYDSVTAMNKQGILLTLFPHKVPFELSDRFINITHLEIVNRIESLGFPLSASTNLYTYVNDFIENIKRLSKKKTMDENTKFFFSHTAEILLAQSTHASALQYVKRQMDMAAEKIDWSTYGNSNNWCHIWDKKNNLEHIFFAVSFHELLTVHRKLTIYIQIDSSIKPYEEPIRKFLIDNSNNLDRGEASKPWFAHLLQKEYSLELENIEDLSNYVSGKLTSEFMKPFNSIQEHLKQLRQGQNQ
jgi:hypothetical protein